MTKWLFINFQIPTDIILFKGLMTSRVLLLLFFPIFDLSYFGFTCYFLCYGKIITLTYKLLLLMTLVFYQLRYFGYAHFKYMFNLKFISKSNLSLLFILRISIS